MKTVNIFAALATGALMGSMCACTPVTSQVIHAYESQVDPGLYAKTYTSTAISDKLYGNDLKTLRAQSDEVIEGEVTDLAYVKSGTLAFTIANVEVKSTLKEGSTLKHGDNVSVLYIGGYIPLADVISEDDSVSHSFDNWSKEDIENTIVYQEHLGEKLPEVGDKAVFFVSDETNFPQWGKLYSLVSHSASELDSSDGGETYMYKREGSKTPERAYSAEAIEMAETTICRLNPPRQSSSLSTSYHRHGRPELHPAI